MTRQLDCEETSREVRLGERDASERQRGEKHVGNGANADAVQFCMRIAGRTVCVFDISG